LSFSVFGLNPFLIPRQKFDLSRVLRSCRDWETVPCFAILLASILHPVFSPWRTQSNLDFRFNVERVSGQLRFSQGRAAGGASRSGTLDLAFPARESSGAVRFLLNHAGPLSSPRASLSAPPLVFIRSSRDFLRSQAQLALP
jgi:hypothetical protein